MSFALVGVSKEEEVRRWREHQCAMRGAPAGGATSPVRQRDELCGWRDGRRGNPGLVSDARSSGGRRKELVGRWKEATGGGSQQREEA